jgi:hypothetical protein
LPLFQKPLRMTSAAFSWTETYSQDIAVCRLWRALLKIASKLADSRRSKISIAPKSESSASKIFRHSGIPAAFKTTFEVFTRASPDNSLERLTERSVGLVTDRPSNVYELLVTLFE